MTAVSSNIRDNCKRGKAVEFLRKNLSPGAVLSVASAYFTVQAYDQLSEQLDAIDSMRFLFGDPDYVNKIDPEKTASKRFSIVNSGLDLRDALRQKSAVKRCAAWIRAKVAIKSVINRALLHGKLYHIIPPGRDSRAMFGSSNFTTYGLGLADNQSNIELNMEVTDQRDRDDLLEWFNEIWIDDDLVRDVKADVLDFLQKIYTNQSPEFIYFKTLFHIFERDLSEAEKTKDLLRQTALDQSEIWQALFEFQKDGVKGIINKIRDYNGCILADSVGLGKTYTALAVIRYFELRNERVLVLTPKKLRENWTLYTRPDTLNPFQKDRFNYLVLNHTDLSRTGGTDGYINFETFNWGAFDLVVIDESHNFRNATSGRPNEDGTPRKSRYQKLMEDVIQSGVKTKVLLLSATPVNNTLRDLRNQIAIITGGDDQAYAAPSPLNIPDLAQLLKTSQRQFTNWAKLPAEQRKTDDLLEKLGSDFFRLLDGLTIARARKHIMRYYSSEMSRLGGFPERLKPITIFSDIDTEGLFLSYDAISDKIEGYTLSLFRPTSFVKPEYLDRYNVTIGSHGQFDQKGREETLIGMMKVNFLKRLESSIHAFELTLKRTIDRIDALEKSLETYKDLKGGSLEVEAEVTEDDVTEDPELFDFAEEFTLGKKKTFKFAHLRVNAFLEALHNDRRQLNEIYVQARDIKPERDKKLAKLKDLLAAKFTKPTTDRNGNPNRKVLVFTAFSDTAVYLYENLHAWAEETYGINSALVSGSVANQTTYRPDGFGSQTDFNTLLIHFSPRSKQREKMEHLPQQGEIDLLIATDCISEGQNLQDCDYLINYDIHWNPVRIIQRFGRIDRIGSRNPAIQLVNFWPTPNLDHYINLKHRVEARMALVDISATQEDNPLAIQQLDDLVDDEELRYRDRQLLRLKDEVLDLEDMNDGISLTDFSLEDFRADLLKFLEKNRELLENAPLGLYSVVPPLNDLFATIMPGVIFCLRQQDAAEDTEAPYQINPLHPCYLVYIQDNGNVRFSFGHAKQILTLFRELCSGKTAAYAELCDLFDRQTQDGQDMSYYDALLAKAMESINKNYRRRIAQGLTQSRNFVIPNQPVTSATFELVTWLVIKDQTHMQPTP